MARPTKSGSKPLNRTAVEWKSKTHIAFATELQGIVERAIKGVPTSPSSSGTSEASVVVDLQRMVSFSTAVLDRHAALLEELQDAAVRHRGLADLCNLVELNIKPGRPRTSNLQPVPMGEGMLTCFRSKTKRKGGRKPTLGHQFETDVYEAVEERRVELRARRSSATIKAALESIFDDISIDTGIRASRLKTERMNSFRAAYRRGKRRAESLAV